MHLPTHHNLLSFFFLNDTAPTEIYPLPLHDALPISRRAFIKGAGAAAAAVASLGAAVASADAADAAREVANSDGVIERLGPEIGRAHVLTPVTRSTRMPPSSLKKKNTPYIRSVAFVR